MRANQQLMLRIAETPGAARPGAAAPRRAPPRRGSTRPRAAHLRNIELYLQRLLTESEQGRAQSTAELRNDIRVLTRTIAALAEGQPRMTARMPLSTAGAAAASDELNPWPGYVDALSTLLMVIIFVLLVFVLAQAFLSVALSGRDRALDRLNRQVAELTDMLSLERGRTGELQLSVAS